MTIEEIEGSDPRPRTSRPRHVSWLLPATGLLTLTAGILIGQATADRGDPAPTPAITPYPLGGTILFGPLSDPSPMLPLDQELAWTAFLLRPVEGVRVSVAISERGDDIELFEYTELVDAGALVSADTMPVGRFIREPGVYVMRYTSTRTGEVLAEGEFELVPSSNQTTTGIGSASA